jgi:HEAT repeat protein
MIPLTLEAIRDIALRDDNAAVRDAAVMKLVEFPPVAIETTLQVAIDDEDEDVRWSARYVMWQSGLSEKPPPGID